VEGMRGVAVPGRRHARCSLPELSRNAGRGGAGGCEVVAAHRLWEGRRPEGGGPGRYARERRRTELEHPARERSGRRLRLLRAQGAAVHKRRRWQDAEARVAVDRVLGGSAAERELAGEHLLDEGDGGGGGAPAQGGGRGP
jgi:hypothetical protein